ncbi:dihydroorotase [bacterium]|nr:dihydroorotase [bacterium]
MKTVLKNSQIGDLLFEDGVITKVGGNIDAPGAEEIDCTGKYIMPGVIDAHVHFRSPGHEEKEDWESGSRAALMGGVTTVFDMPNTSPQTITLEALEEKRALAGAKSHVNFGLFFGGTGKNLEEIKRAKGIVGVKVYMGQTTGQTVDETSEFMDGLLRDLFENTERVIAIHAEDEELIKKHNQIYKDDNSPEIHSLIRSDLVSFSACRRAVHLAKKYGGNLHVCHVSTKKEIELLSKYPEVTCEVTPHHLFFTVSDYSRLGNFIKTNPPVRSQNDVDALWEALRNGLVSFVATDHAPHLKVEKERGYWDAPAGVPGVEFALPLMLDSVNNGLLGMEDVVRLMCEGPANVYGVRGKGFLKEGYDADITVVDMDISREVCNEDVVSKCGWTPYAGMTLRGWPVMTFVGGVLMMEGREIVSGNKGKEVVF